MQGFVLFFKVYNAYIGQGGGCVMDMEEGNYVVFCNVGIVILLLIVIMGVYQRSLVDFVNGDRKYIDIKLQFIYIYIYYKEKIYNVDFLKDLIWKYIKVFCRRGVILLRI